MRSRSTAAFTLIECLFYLSLSACSSARSTATKANIQLTLTAIPSSPLTQETPFIPTPRVKLTPPASTPSPALELTQPFTETPRWKTSAVPVQIMIHIPIDAVGWETDQVAYVDSLDLGRGLIEARTGQEFEPTPPPTASPAPETKTPYKWFSPDKKHFIECTPEGVRLYATAGQKVINESSLKLECTSLPITWAPTSSIVALLASGDVYLWRTDGSTPSKLNLDQAYVHVAWSPDATRLLLLSGLLPDADKHSFNLVDLTGKPLLTKPVAIFSKVGDAYWPTREVFAIIYGCGTLCSFEEYYDSANGRLLTRITDLYQTFQPAAFSPDKAWIVIDHEHNDLFDQEHIYDLFDLYKKQIFPLANSSDIYLQFSHWSLDSSTFYFVSRPTSGTAISDPKTPFGLLALTPRTKDIEIIFEQVMEAEWSPTQQLIWVVFPARQADGSLGLAGGIFDPDNTQLTGHEFISDQVLYANPAKGSLVPTAWSNDGTRVVFGDMRGNLSLLNTNGTSQLLASNLPTTPWPNEVHYAWAPDDQRLLVQYGEQAWIVSVPDP